MMSDAAAEIGACPECSVKFKLKPNLKKFRCPKCKIILSAENGAIVVSTAKTKKTPTPKVSSTIQTKKYELPPSSVKLKEEIALPDEEDDDDGLAKTSLNLMDNADIDLSIPVPSKEEADFGTFDVGDEEEEEDYSETIIQQDDEGLKEPEIEDSSFIEDTEADEEEPVDSEEEIKPPKKIPQISKKLPSTSRIKTGKKQSSSRLASRMEKKRAEEKQGGKSGKLVTVGFIIISITLTVLFFTMNLSFLDSIGESFAKGVFGSQSTSAEETPSE